MIERAAALGEPLEDPLLLFSVLYGLWAAEYVAFNGEALRELAAQFLSLAEKQSESAPLVVGHRLMGTSLHLTGKLSEGRAHYDQAIAMHDPADHRPLATRFGQDVRVAILCYRSWARWLLGYPEAAREDAENALQAAREIRQAATLMYALTHVIMVHWWIGDHVLANTQTSELLDLADEKGALLWKAYAMLKSRLSN